MALNELILKFINRLYLQKKMKHVKNVKRQLDSLCMSASNKFQIILKCDINK